VMRMWVASVLSTMMAMVFLSDPCEYSMFDRLRRENKKRKGELGEARDGRVRKGDVDRGGIVDVTSVLGARGTPTRSYRIYHRVQSDQIQKR